MAFKKILFATSILLLIGIAYRLNLQNYLTLDGIKEQQNTFTQYYNNNPFLTIALFFGIYVALTAVSFPGAAVLTLLAGALFGSFSGTIIVSFASTIGATLAFWGARYLFRDSFQKKFGDRIATFNEGIKKEGGFYLFTLRLIPIVPFFVINIVMGLTPMSLFRYYIISQIGMLPGTFIYVNAGQKLSEIESVRQIFSIDILLSFAALGVFPYFAKMIVNSFRSRQTYRRWKKPQEFDFNLVAIGAGAAGLVTAYIGAAAKAKVALIEKHKMGGDCLNTGCVPSKAIIRTAKFLADVKKSSKLGVHTANAEFDFADVMARVHDKIKDIEPHDSVDRYSKMGVECISGQAKIISPWEIAVGDRIIRTKNIVLATGAEPILPDIEGLNQIPYLTSENLWQLKKLPKKLLVLGGGYIGCELAQAFVRLGSEVTIVERRSNRLLFREDEDVAKAIHEALIQDGVTVRTGENVEKFENFNNKVHVTFSKLNEKVEYDNVLIALGRRARTKGFGLEELGIQLGSHGQIKTDEYLRTNIQNIYACGDCMSPYQFTHVAAHQAWYCAVNSMLSPFYKFKVDYRTIPSCMYTDPEVANVGLNEIRARDANVAFEVVKYDFSDLDRAIVDNNARGMVKVLVKPGTDRILGVTIVGPQAADVMSEFVLAMKYNIGLNKILGTIHSYPTYSEANKYAAGAWKKANVSPAALKWAERFNTWRRT